MRLLKIIGITVSALAALVLIAAIFIHKEYTVKREVVIHRTPQEVFNYIKHLEHQHHFSVWLQADPDLKSALKGTDGTPGAIYSWASKKKEVGEGTQIIVNMMEGRRIDYDVHVTEPLESHNHAYFSLSPVGEEQTQVIWGLDGKMNYPFNIVFLFCDMESVVGDGLTKGLDNLKLLLEEK